MIVKQVCEVCWERPANSITHNKENDNWYFCCNKCLIDGYYIEFDRLDELDWEEHMSKKGWVDWFSFKPRFKWAMQFIKVNNYKRGNKGKIKNEY